MPNSLLPKYRLKHNFIISLFIIAVVIGISETLVMLLLDALQQWNITLTPIQSTLLDVILLVCLSTPMLWRLALRPLVNQIMSEQVEATERIRQNAERRTTQFNAILDAFTSATITIDKVGIVQSFNKGAENIFGYSRSEIMGNNISCLMPAAIAVQHDSYLQRYFDTQKTNIIGKRREVEGLRKNGDTFSAMLRVNPMEIDGELFFFGVVDDISETRILQAQLIQSQKLEAIGQLAAGVAHEINTPIQYIGDNLSALYSNFEDIIAYRQALHELADDRMKTQLESLTDKYDLNFILEDSPKAIKQAQEGVERVAEIIKAMKTFSHVEQGQNKQLINLHQALNSALTISRNNYKYIAEVETDFSPEVGSIECYASELNQVFLNLLINAAHAIEENKAGMGKINIVTRKLDNSVEILIQDNGAGIPITIQEKVFNLFFTTKEVGKGTGQGLSLSHSIIVEKHGGKLFFESSPGLGTTFHIQLPIKLEDQG
jgi:PAS domain S-box-containing protein